VFIDSVSYATVKNSLFFNSTAASGIVLEGCTHCDFSNDRIDTIFQSGWFASGSSDLNVSNITFRDCSTNSSGLNRAFWSEAETGQVVVNGIQVIDDQSTATCDIIGGDTNGTSIVQVNGIRQFISNGTLSIQPGGEANELYALGYPITSGSLGGSSVGANACTSTTVTVPGAQTFQTVVVSPTGGTWTTSPLEFFNFDGFVSAANTVTVRECNHNSSASETPTAETFNVRVQ
jgi:hypothetical protein